MQCPSCGKTGFVNISGKRFCSNCGAKLAAPGSPATMSDIKTSPKPLNLKADTTSSQAATAAVQAGGVLDLRSKPEAKPAAEIPSPAAVQPAPAIEPAQPTPSQPAPAPKVSADVRAEPATAPALPELKPRAALTAEVPKSPAIQKFTPHPAVAAPQPAEELPAAVATQVDAMRSQAASAPLPGRPQSPGLQEVLATAKQTAAPSIVKIAAALAAVAVMSGLVWLQNSPKLAFHNAAGKAGIDASLPTYIPSSYHQTGPVGIGSGQLTLNFSSPSSNAPLSITQKRTDWDSNSLRDNFISRQTDNFLAVQGQGLVIYLYDDHASWVNHGVWYKITGTSKLSREQVLKIAYGL